MLSISLPMKGVGHAKYYVELAQEDYYNNASEEPGRWFGKGAESLGLLGQVNPKPYQNLLKGYSPDGRSDLVQNAADPDRQTGWDLTFSAPKSVSVLWALSSEGTRRQIENAQRRAVETVLSFLEETAGVTRRGKGGTRQEPVKLIFATFLHRTSRAQDPQIHTHGVLTNAGLRQDGTTGALRSQNFFQAKMTSGALYQVAFAAELRHRLGVTTKRAQIGFQIEGVPKDLCRALSKRRVKIEKCLEERGGNDAILAKYATLETRPKKVKISHEELRSRWVKVAFAHGWAEANAAALIRSADRHSCSKEELQKSFEAELATIPEEKRTHGRLRGLAAGLAVELHANPEIARPLLEDLQKREWLERALFQNENQERSEGQEGFPSHEKRKSGQKATFEFERPSQRPKESSENRETERSEGLGIGKPQGERQSSQTFTRESFGKDEGARCDGNDQSNTKNKEGESGQWEEERGRSGSGRHRFGKARTVDAENFGKKRLWTATRIAQFDPVLAEARGDRRTLYFKYREVILSGEIHAPVISEPMRRTRGQTERNKSFAQAFSQKVETIFPEKQTPSRLTWNAVNLACEHGADAWALFYTIRNLHPAAERGFIHIERKQLFPNSPLTFIRQWRTPRLVLGERARRWGDILWKKDFFIADLRIQKRLLFPRAPKINPLHSLELPALRLKFKKPDWLSKMKAKESLRAKETVPKSSEHSRSFAQTGSKKEQSNAQSQ